jgi:hypothetical protein
MAKKEFNSQLYWEFVVKTSRDVSDWPSWKRTGSDTSKAPKKLDRAAADSHRPARKTGTDGRR